MQSPICRVVIFCSLTSSHLPAVAETNSAFVSYSLWALLAFVLLQSLAIITLAKVVARFKSLPAIDPELKKTKFHLRREIARHETTSELLLETREYLSCLINSIPAIVIGVAEDLTVTHWNRAAMAISGVNNHSAIGQKLPRLLPSPRITVEDVLNTIEHDTPIKREALAIGDGINARFYDLTIQPLVAPESRGAVILIQDVTLKVRVERSMIQNEKMLSLGKMAAGLAHEINNPLAAILNNAQTIERRLQGSLNTNLEAAEECGVSFPALERYLEVRGIDKLLADLHSAGNRAAGIVNTMLEFSHAYRSSFESTDLALLIDKSLELAANTIGLKANKKIKMPFVIRDFDTTTPRIDCSPSEIQQVLLNLLLNAAQAIHYAKPPITNPTIGVRLWFDQMHVVIEIKDNGPGMEETVQKHIFEPFFTTKKVGSGTGLGLSVSYFIIKEHHQGQIEVHSKLNEGTVFIIQLPRHQTLTQPSERHAPTHA